MSKREYLSEEEIVKLVLDVRAGNEDSLEILLNEHMGLIGNIANRYVNRGQDREDIVQVGTIAFLRSVNLFDPSRGTKFATYAGRIVQGKIQHFMRDNALVRLPRPLMELATKILTNGVKDEPVEVIKTKLMLEDKQDKLLREALDVIHDYTAIPWSLDRPVFMSDTEERMELQDTLSGDLNGENWMDTWASTSDVREAISKLEERERRIIILSFYDGLPQSDIGVIMGVSQMQISRLQRRAVKKLRALIEHGREQYAKELEVR
jgi:RNA polymerase sporulation-specific sigma factor